MLSSGSHPTVAVVIVTYNSGRVLDMCLECLRRQTRPADLIVIVDNDSPDPAYLEAVPRTAPFKLERSATNRGFCGGNNIGYGHARGCKYVLFLNPDAFLGQDFLETAVHWMERSEHASVGCLTGTLLGFDVERREPTGRIDSTGIFQKRHGRWYDRGKGETFDATATAAVEDVPAICGALMFCRTQALEAVLLGNREVFDERFFMYKEDIDLSVRLRARGWRLTYVPEFRCHHGRGWQSRAQSTHRSRYLSARNELRVCARNRWRGLPYSLAKFVYVALLERLRLALTAKPAETHRERS